MTPPYSLEQAQYLFSMFKNVAGTEFEEKDVLVEDIAVVPFDQSSRQRFILYYMVMGADAQETVLQEYKGFLFDVIVIARNNKGEVVTRNLSDFLALTRNEIIESEFAASVREAELMCSGKA